MTTDLRAAIEAVYHATRYELGGDFHEPVSGYKDCERFAEDAMDMATPQLAALLDAAPAPGLDVERLTVAVYAAAFEAQDDKDDHWLGFEEVAARIAREYAALASSQPELGL